MGLGLYTGLQIIFHKLKNGGGNNICGKFCTNKTIEKVSLKKLFVYLVNNIGHDIRVNTSLVSK